MLTRKECLAVSIFKAGVIPVSYRPLISERGGPDGFVYVLTDESDGKLLKVSPGI